MAHDFIVNNWFQERRNDPMGSILLIVGKKNPQIKLNYGCFY